MTPHKFFAESIAEFRNATENHGPMHGGHEAYAVIKEEVDEFWDEVKKKNPDRENMRKELVQIAAMACRAVVDLDLQ